MSLVPNEVYRLDLFEECVGILRDLPVMNGLPTAIIGRVHLVLPLSLEHNLLPLIGQRIAILRTDLPQREYLFRILTEEPNPVERDRRGG